MNKAKWLLATGLVALTAGCVQETTTYAPRTAYVQPASTYYAQPTTTYYAQPTPTYYTAQPTTTYYAQPTPSQSQRYWNSSTADADRDGIPNRYDRDANGDRVPDRYQGR